MSISSIADNHEVRGRERMINKARRLLDEGRVSERDDGTFHVEGDTTRHILAFGKSELHCSCKAGSFARGCSHRMAIEILLSLRRQGVA